MSDKIATELAAKIEGYETLLALADMGIVSMYPADYLLKKEYVEALKKELMEITGEGLEEYENMSDDELLKAWALS